MTTAKIEELMVLENNLALLQKFHDVDDISHLSIAKLLDLKRIHDDVFAADDDENSMEMNSRSSSDPDISYHKY